MEKLRQRMIEDMKLRGLAASTQTRYLEGVKSLTKHYNRPPDQLTQEEVRKYLLYLIDPKGYSKNTFRINLFALKFLYRRTLHRDWRFLESSRVKSDKRLPVVLSREEVWSLLDLVRRPKARMSLTLMYTWGSNLSYHPHVHCLVTGGGLSPDGHTWMPARDNYLVPVVALSRLFRGLFLKRINKQLGGIDLPKSLWQKDWVVHCKPAVHSTRTVLQYLGRCINRIAITNSRIISIDNGKVTFRYRCTHTRQMKIMTVSAEEFIRRFLQHVLPAGFHKVRYYGLWSPSYRKHLCQMQHILAEPGDQGQEQCQEDLDGKVPTPEARSCPHCQTGTLIRIASLSRQWRVPP